MEVQPIQERISRFSIRTLHPIEPCDRGAYAHPTFLKIELQVIRAEKKSRVCQMLLRDYYLFVLFRLLCELYTPEILRTEL